MLITGRGANDPGQNGTPGPGMRFHVNEIAGLAPFVDVNPGFSAEDAATHITPAIASINHFLAIAAWIRLEGLSHRKWTCCKPILLGWQRYGVFSPVTNPLDSLEVRSSVLGSAIATGTAEDVAGYDFTSTDSTGFIHNHPIFDFDLDNKSATTASTGIFLAGFEFNMDLNGDNVREIARPHYVAFYNGPPSTMKTAAMAAVNTFLDENFAQLRLWGDVSPLGIDNLPDDKVDAADIDALLAAVAAQNTDPLFDLDGNTFVDAQDVTSLFDRLGTNYGDANLDSNVDGTDLGIWQANYGTNAGWARGDFDGRATVDGRDFLLWQRNFGFSEGQLATSQTIPEPSTFLASLMGILALACRRN